MVKKNASKKQMKKGFTNKVDSVIPRLWGNRAIVPGTKTIVVFTGGKSFGAKYEKVGMFTTFDDLPVETGVRRPVVANFCGHHWNADGEKYPCADREIRPGEINKCWGVNPKIKNFRMEGSTLVGTRTGVTKAGKVQKIEMRSLWIDPLTGRKGKLGAYIKASASSYRSAKPAHREAMHGRLEDDEVGAMILRSAVKPESLDRDGEVLMPASSSAGPVVETPEIAAAVEPVREVDPFQVYGYEKVKMKQFKTAISPKLSDTWGLPLSEVLKHTWVRTTNKQGRSRYLYLGNKNWVITPNLAVYKPEWIPETKTRLVTDTVPRLDHALFGDDGYCFYKAISMFVKDHNEVCSIDDVEVPPQFQALADAHANHNDGWVSQHQITNFLERFKVGNRPVTALLRVGDLNFCLHVVPQAMLIDFTVTGEMPRLHLTYHPIFDVGSGNFPPVFEGVEFGGKRKKKVPNPPPVPKRVARVMVVPKKKKKAVKMQVLHNRSHKSAIKGSKAKRSNAVVALPPGTDQATYSQEINLGLFASNSGAEYATIQVFPVRADYWCMTSKIWDRSPATGQVATATSTLYAEASKYAEGSLVSLAIDINFVVPRSVGNVQVAMLYSITEGLETPPENLWRVAEMRRGQVGVQFFQNSDTKRRMRHTFKTNPTPMVWGTEPLVEMGNIFIVMRSAPMEPDLAPGPASSSTTTATPRYYSGNLISIDARPTVSFKWLTPDSRFLGSVLNTFLVKRDTASISRSHWLVDVTGSDPQGQVGLAPYIAVEVSEDQSLTTPQSPSSSLELNSGLKRWKLTKVGMELYPLFNATFGVNVNETSFPVESSGYKAFAVGAGALGKLILGGVSLLFPEFAPICAVISAAGEWFFGVLNASGDTDVTSPNVILDDSLMTPVYNAASSSSGYASGLPTTVKNTVEGSFSRLSNFYTTAANVFNTWVTGASLSSSTSVAGIELAKLMDVSRSTQLAPIFQSQLFTLPMSSMVPWGLVSAAGSGIEAILSLLPTASASMQMPQQSKEYPEFGRHRLSKACQNEAMDLTYDAARPSGWHRWTRVNLQAIVSSMRDRDDPEAVSDVKNVLITLWNLMNGTDIGLVTGGVWALGETAFPTGSIEFELLEIVDMATDPPHNFPIMMNLGEPYYHVKGILANRGSPLCPRVGKTWLEANYGSFHTAIQSLLGNQDSDYCLLFVPQFLSQTQASTFLPIERSIRWRVEGLVATIGTSPAEYTVSSHKYLSSGVLTDCLLDESTATEPMWLYTIHPSI